ncbi:hypothetical protein U0C82_18335 [Fulvimarina sp. 2208YS6-2-32]|uniref:Uncharacterized protein n=1 Tax=Fulvimarina uroteuthidis TaxID=3098149 RepID=A0ABU5I7D6_9HYPH|nr:hypothetical protein [Fulvimarina sp. 2208YS6-2-32]MDY8111085.1 hypothetical protein [Fulvimarina sp. 2208YS6-2-32]
MKILRKYAVMVRKKFFLICMKIASSKEEHIKTREAIQSRFRLFHRELTLFGSLIGRDHPSYANEIIWNVFDLTLEEDIIDQLLEDDIDLQLTRLGAMTHLMGAIRDDLM